MDNNRIKPRVLLIFGAPCSGKSTFGEKFAKKFGLSFYDLSELKEKYNLSRKVLLLIIEQVLKTGQTILVEGEQNTVKEREELRNMIRRCGYEPYLIWIQTDVNTIKSRLKMRYKNISKAKQVFDDAIAGVEAPEDFERPIILSGKHTFDTQTRHVVTGLAELSETK